MTQRLAGFPSGLLSLLGSQSFGSAPKELGDVIIPSIELLELYLVSKQEGEVGVAPAPANGINVCLTVPTGEVWRVNFGGCFCSTGVGVTLDWTPAIFIDGGVVPLGDSQSQAASLLRMRAFAQSPIWLQAGMGIGIYVSAIVGVPTLSASVGISRMRA